MVNKLHLFENYYREEIKKNMILATDGKLSCIFSGDQFSVSYTQAYIF